MPKNPKYQYIKYDMIWIEYDNHFSSIARLNSLHCSKIPQVTLTEKLQLKRISFLNGKNEMEKGKCMIEKCYNFNNRIMLKENVFKNDSLQSHLLTNTHILKSNNMKSYTFLL